MTLTQQTLVDALRKQELMYGVVVHYELVNDGVDVWSRPNKHCKKYHHGVFATWDTTLESAVCEINDSFETLYHERLESAKKTAYCGSR